MKFKALDFIPDPVDWGCMAGEWNKNGVTITPEYAASCANYKLQESKGNKVNLKITLPSGRQIGTGCETFVIAEVGSNWKTLDDCLSSIGIAKDCGADAVKFQLYDTKALYGIIPKVTLEGSYGEYVTDLVTPGSMPVEWLPKLKEKADQVGIEFMCSAFSPELIDIVNPYVNIHKLASAEMNHVRILDQVMRFGKPIIMSTGASGLGEIQESMKYLGPEQVILLYCVASYPARYVNFGKMIELKQLFKTLIGFSDHTTDINIIPSTSLKYGACVIEKHVNFTAHEDTPDAGHSLSQPEFKAMVRSIRDIYSIDNPDISPPVQEEIDMFVKHNRRLIAIRDIKSGDEFREGENFGIYRSLKKDTHAFSPFMIDQVNGKNSLKDIEAGNGIGPGDIG